MAGDDRRRRRTLLSAPLTVGSGEILDFPVPLWAGAVLGASPSAIGALVAVEMVVSFLGVRRQARVLAAWA